MSTRPRKKRAAKEVAQLGSLGNDDIDQVLSWSRDAEEEKRADWLNAIHQREAELKLPMNLVTKTEQALELRMGFFGRLEESRVPEKVVASLLASKEAGGGAELRMGYFTRPSNLGDHEDDDVKVPKSFRRGENTVREFTDTPPINDSIGDLSKPTKEEFEGSSENDKVDSKKHPPELGTGFFNQHTELGQVVVTRPTPTENLRMGFFAHLESPQEESAPKRRKVKSVRWRENTVREFTQTPHTDDSREDPSKPAKEKFEGSAENGKSESMKQAPELGMGFFNQLAELGQDVVPRPTPTENLKMGFFTHLESQQQENAPKQRTVKTATSEPESSTVLPVDDRAYAIAEYFTVSFLPPIVLHGGSYTPFASNFCRAIVVLHTIEALFTNFGPKARFLHLPFAPITPLQHLFIDHILIGALILCMLLCPEDFGPFPYHKVVVVLLSHVICHFLCLRTTVCEADRMKRIEELQVTQVNSIRKRPVH